MHVLFYLFRAGKNSAGAVSHEIEAVLLQPKSWRMGSRESRVQKFARQLGVTNVGNVTAVAPFTFVLSIAAHSTKQMRAKKWVGTFSLAGDVGKEGH